MKIPVINRSGFPLPQYKTAGAAAFDIQAFIPGPNTDVEIIEPGETVKIHTGLFMAIPKDFELQIRSRSSIASEGIIIANSPGTIDSDYRGELKIIMSNISKTPFIINHGDRIAQGVVAIASQMHLVEVEELDETERGAGGFGSTGKA